MNYQKFLQKLPSFYHNWGQELVSPKSDQFSKLLDRVNGMTTPNILQLLNWAVNCLEDDEVYCEIGCFQGSTLIGALLDNSNHLAYAVDDFSEFDDQGENVENLGKNLALFNLDDQVLFCEQNFEEFFFELRDSEPQLKIGVYFYDGAHDYRSQLLGLLLARPFLADQSLIIVDDSNWNGVQQANWDFMASYPECKLLLNLPTPKNRHPSFWNGIQVFSWDVQQKSNYNWSSFNDNFRNPKLIQALYDFHFNFDVFGNISSS
jgi:protein O-GlcNAc transferase